MMEDLKKLQEGKNRVGTRLPEFKLEDYTHLSEVHFKGKIPPEMLELAIVKGIDLKPPAGVQAVDSYVAVNFPFTPDPQLQNLKTKKIANNNSPGSFRHFLLVS